MYRSGDGFAVEVWLCKCVGEPSGCVLAEGVGDAAAALGVLAEAVGDADEALGVVAGAV